MNTQILKETIQQLFAGGKGILAMDESTPTCDKPFAILGIPKTEEMRRKYRLLMVQNIGFYFSI